MSEGNPLISIVIPAYNRTGMLFEAIHSCFAQAYRPIEIIVGDDSSTDAVGGMIAAIACPEGITLRYERHARNKGQSGNVNWLFGATHGARTMLLHDDDLLWPGGLDALVAVWDAHPGTGCVFGKQVVILEDGEIDIAQSLQINAMYARADRPTGPQRPAESVGLLQQVPNNCYLVDSALARAVGYRPEAVVGLAADADFGIRLGLAMQGRDFVYADAYVSAYRITRGSMMRGGRNQDHHLFYRYVEGLELPPESEAARALCLDRHGAAAVLDAANAGDVALARHILGAGHCTQSRLSVHGLLTMISLASPRTGAAIRPYFKAGVQTLRRLTENRRAHRTAPPTGAGTGSPTERHAIEAMIDTNHRLIRERRAAWRAAMGERAAA